MPVLRVPKISLLAIGSIALMAASKADTTPSAKLTYAVPLSGHAETNVVSPAAAPTTRMDRAWSG